MKKIVAIGTIALFIGLAFAPAIGSQVVKNERIRKVEVKEGAETIEITIREYNGDGTFRERKREMPMDKAKELHEKLKNEDFDKKLTILKEYNLTSKDANLEKYKKEVLERVNELGLSRDEIDGLIKNYPAFAESDGFFNILCKVEVCMLGLFLPIGGSTFTGILNCWFCLNGYPVFIPSIDLFNMGIGYGNMSMKGLLGIQKGEDIGFSCVLFCFAGVCVSFPFHPWAPAWSFFGFSFITAGFTF
jgi:hypothetical protein